MSDNRDIYTFPEGFTAPHLLSGLPERSSVLVGFSGGADSTALLHLLKKYTEQCGAELYAAHINHCIRGEEADRDEAFCKSFAESLGVRFFSLRADVPKIASQTGESIETAARRVRYNFFDALMKENGIAVLATAHNADDNLETILFNMARGTGLSGLCGIPPCRPCANGIVVRPILNMEKREILNYCSNNQLSFVTDSTNTDTDYTRNKIRAQIIPVMREVNSAAVKNAARMSENLREDSLCIEKLSEGLAEKFGDGYAIDCEKLCASQAAIANRAIIRLYCEVSGGRALERTHVSALRQLAENRVPHSAVSLPSDIEGVIENKKLFFRKKAKAISVPESYEVELKEGSNFISQTNCEIFIGSSHCTKNVYKNSILMSIDSDKIKNGLVARNKRDGDKIRSCGMSKSVKKLMCDKKIPLDLRSRIPMICDGNGIIAIPFVAIRDEAKAKKTSKTDILFILH